MTQSQLAFLDAEIVAKHQAEVARIVTAAAERGALRPVGSAVGYVGVGKEPEPARVNARTKHFAASAAGEMFPNLVRAFRQLVIMISSAKLAAPRGREHRIAR